MTMDATGFDNTFQVINTGGLPQPCFMIRIINDSNTGIDIAYKYNPLIQVDIWNDHVLANHDITLYFETNGQPASYMALMAKGMEVFVRGAQAGIGTVYLAGYYVEQS